MANGFHGTNLPGNEAEGEIGKKGSVNKDASFKDTVGGIISEAVGSQQAPRASGPELSRNG